MNDKFKTEFALAERVDPVILEEQVKFFDNNDVIHQLANSVPNLLLVLNYHRQIVYANQNFIKLLQLPDKSEILGKRPGEAVNCVHSTGEGGCGTTQFCSKCGAVNAILESHKNLQSIKECRILTVDNDALDFMVVASPYLINDEMFTIFALSDISDEKRRKVLERTFFHDVLNTAGGITGLTDVIQYVEDTDEQKQLLRMIHHSSESLVDEIKLQRQLSSAESGDLTPEISEVSSLAILKEVSEIYSRHQVMEERKIIIDSLSVDTNFHTDKTLLKRVIGNMIKNALEASEKDGIVTIATSFKSKDVLFSVHNDSYMPKEIQLQLFKRSFSTKGSGRGIGTYSIKLFGEKYLKGKVWFESSKDKGTTFYLKLPNQVE